MRITLCIFSLLFLFCGVNGVQNYLSAMENAVSASTQTETLLKDESIFNAEQRIQRFLSSFRIYNINNLLVTIEETGVLNELQRSVLEAKGNYSVSSICLNQTLSIFSGISSRQLWAISMVDALGKLESNVLGGNLFLAGAYDECLQVVSNVSFPGGQFNGEYFRTFFEIPGQSAQNAGIGGGLKRGIYLGLCLPHSCTELDVKNLLNSFLALIPSMTVGGQNVTLQAKDVLDATSSQSFDTQATIVFVFLMLYIALMLLATLYDIFVIQYAKGCGLSHDLTAKVNMDGEKSPLLGDHTEVSTEYPGTLGKMLLSFSVYTNGKKILDTRQAPGSLQAINGIRFLSMSWVMLGHTYAFGAGVSSNLGQFFPHLINTWTYQAIINALVSVDSFFTLSGLLVGYSVLKEMDRKSGKLNWLMFYFHRFWRLTPPYMLLILVYVSLFQYLFNGPLWPLDGPEMNKCRDTWWTNLLYVNNLVRADNMCLAWSWYLANDMQFYVLSPLLLLPLYFKPKLGAVVSFVFLLTATITPGVITKSKHFPAAFFSGTDTTDMERFGNYFKEYYIVPWCRMGPYIVGLYTGYLLYKNQCQCKINKVLNIVIWLMAAGAACSILYGLYGTMNGTYHMSDDVSALYNATNRSVWGACLCWVIFTCVTGNSGPVNKLLSWKGFVPLSRLTYTGYLIHPIIMFSFYYSRRSTLYFTDYTMVMLFLGFMVLSFMAAFLLSLAFESPMMALEKVIFRRGDKKQ